MFAKSLTVLLCAYLTSIYCAPQHFQEKNWGPPYDRRPPLQPHDRGPPPRPYDRRPHLPPNDRRPPPPPFDRRLRVPPHDWRTPASPRPLSYENRPLPYDHRSLAYANSPSHYEHRPPLYEQRPPAYKRGPAPIEHRPPSLRDHRPTPSADEPAESYYNNDRQPLDKRDSFRETTEIKFPTLISQSESSNPTGNYNNPTNVTYYDQSQDVQPTMNKPLIDNTFDIDRISNNSQTVDHSQSVSKVDYDHASKSTVQITKRMPHIFQLVPVTPEN